MSTGRKRGVELVQIGSETAEEIEFEDEAPIDAQNRSLEARVRAEFGKEKDIDWRLEAVRLPVNADGTVTRGAEKTMFWFPYTEGGYDAAKQRLYDKHGSGSYRLKVRKNGALFATEDFALECPRDWKAKMDTPDAPPQADMTLGIVQLLAQQMERQTAMILGALQKIEAGNSQIPARDPLADMERMSAIFANMGGAKQAAPALGADSLIKVLEMGMTLGKSASGDGKGMMDLVSDLLQSPIAATIAEGMAAKAAQVKQPARVRVAPPAVSSQPVTATTRPNPKPLAPATQPPTMPPALREMIEAIQGIARLRNEGWTPEMVAESFYETATDMALTLTLNSTEDEAYTVVSRYADIPREWIAAFLVELKAIDADAANSPDNVNGDAEHESGADAGNAETHAGIGETIPQESGDIHAGKKPN